MQYLIEALMLGFLYGFGPCTIFCAPIIIPLIFSSSKSGKEGSLQALVFGFGRVTSYCILGFFAGYLGTVLSGLISNQLIGVFMIGLGVLIFLKKYPKCPFVHKVKGKHTAFVSGMIIGLSPCYPLIGALSLVVLTHSAVNGMLIGLLFGVGTLLSPLIALGFLAGWWTKRSKEFYNINLLISSGFLIILGLLNIFSI